MQEWTSLRLELLARGYRYIEYREFRCADDGLFRVALEIPASTYGCPACGREYTAAFVAEGFTRREIPIVELIEKAFKVTARTHPWALPRQLSAGQD